ncbi:hypothetical protein [Halostreptopolyspora alba]
MESTVLAEGLPEQRSGEAEETPLAPSGRLLYRGRQDYNVRFVPPILALGGVTQFDTSGSCAAAVRHGRVHTWPDDWGMPIPQEQQGSITKVCVSEYMDHMLALDSAGHVHVWGPNDCAGDIRKYMPDNVQKGGVTDIATSPRYGVAAIGNRVYCWSKWNDQRELEFGQRVLQTETHKAVVVVRTADNTLHYRYVDNMGWVEFEELKIPEDLKNRKFFDVSLRGGMAMGLTDNGEAHVWGLKGRYRHMEPNAVDVAAGTYFAYACFKDGTATVWDHADDGSLLDSTYPGPPAEQRSDGFWVKRIDFGVSSVLEVSGAGIYWALGMAPSVACHPVLDRGVATPEKVKPNSDMYYSWDLGNLGPATAKNIVVTVELPPGVTLHPNYNDWPPEKRPKKAGENRYQFRIEDQDEMEGGWTPPLMVRVSPDAGGDLVATASVTADHMDSDPPSELTCPAKATVSADGTDWQSLARDWAIFLSLAAAAGALYAAAAFCHPPGGGGGGGGNTSRFNNRDRNKNKNQRAKLDLDASARPSNPKAGDEVTLTFKLKNTDTKNSAKAAFLNVFVPKGVRITRVSGGEQVGDSAAYWAAGSLGTEESATMKVTAKVDADPPGEVIAVGSSGAFNASPVVKTTTVRPKPKISWSLSRGKAAPEEVQPGQEVVLSWDLTNSGPSPVRDGTFTVTVPRGLESPVVRVNGSRVETTPKGNQLVATLPTLEAKAQPVPVTVTGTVAQKPPGDLTTQLQLHAANASPDTLSKSATAKVVTIVTVSGGPVGTPVAGRELGYTWSVQNTGKVEALDVVLTATLPPESEATFLDATGGVTPKDSKLEWKVGSLPPNRSFDAAFHVKLDHGMAGKPTSFTGEATAENARKDSKTLPDNVSEKHRLGVHAEVSSSTVRNGDPVTFTFELTNAGPSDAHDVSVAVGSEAPMTEQKILDPQGREVSSPFTIEKLEPNKPQKVTLSGKAPSCSSFVGKLDLTPRDEATVTGSRSVTVQRDATLVVTPTPATATAKAGEPVTVSWKVEKRGKDQFDAASLVVPPFAQGTIVQAKVGSSVVKPKTTEEGVRVPLPDINTTPATVDVQLFVAAATAAGTVDVMAWGETSSTGATDREPVKLTVTRERTLALTYDKSPDIVPGEPAELAFTVDNTGPSDCEEVLCTIDPASAFRLREAKRDGWPVQVDQLNGNWQINLGLIEAAGHTQIVASADVDPALPAPTVRVPAKLSTSETGTTYTTNGDPDRPVAPSSDLKLTADRAPKQVILGDNAVYGWTVENDEGPSVAADLTLTVTIKATGTTVTVDQNNAPDFTITSPSPNTTVLTWTGTLSPDYTKSLIAAVSTATAAGNLQVTAKLTQKDPRTGKGVERATPTTTITRVTV